MLPPPAQIQVNSDRVIRVTQVGSEEELRELEESKVWNFLSSLLKEKLNSTNIDVDLYSNKTCLKVELLEDSTKYCIVLSRCTSGLCLGSGSSHKGQRACAAACSKEKRACRGGILPFLGLQKGRDTRHLSELCLGHCSSLLAVSVSGWSLHSGYPAGISPNLGLFFFQGLTLNCSWFSSWACCCSSVGTC